MIPAKRWAIIGLAVIALAFGLFWWNTHDTKAAGADDAHLASIDSALAVLASRERRADTVLIRERTVYRTAAATADVSHAAADADTTNLAKQRAALTAETTARKSCAAALVAADDVIAACKARGDALEAKVKILEHPHRPRLVPFTDPLYDVGARVPVAQAGADYRLFGDRLTLRGMVQQRIEPKATPTFLLGAHITY